MSSQKGPTTTLVTNEDELGRVSERFGRVPRVGLDIESNGLFAYRARLCTIQIGAGLDVAVVDALATTLGPLGPLVASREVRKIVHDVAFDARILAEAGLTLTHVHDTSIAARMLSRPATGLASLLGSELGITVDKKMQHHDWAERPLEPVGLRYLADDVVHLEPLAEKLFGEVEARGIGAEVEEETRYRISTAIAAAGSEDPRPPYLRLKGIERTPRADLPLLRHLADLREEKARELDVPPYKVLAPDVLHAIAKARPRTMADLDKINGATKGRGRAIASLVLQAVTRGLDEGTIPEEHAVLLERPRVPQAVTKARRAREQRLTKWRKAEAAKRSVDEQVILPGHCLQDLADITEPTLDAIASVKGIGAFRVERDGAALLAALTAPEPT